MDSCEDCTKEGQGLPQVLLPEVLEGEQSYPVGLMKGKAF